MTVSHRRQAEWLANFFGLPLTEQMKAAACVLEDASRKHHSESPIALDLFTWSPEKLRSVAEGWEAEEQEGAKREAQITELANVIYANVCFGGNMSGTNFDALPSGIRDSWKNAAKAALDAGWTKP